MSRKLDTEAVLSLEPSHPTHPVDRRQMLNRLGARMLRKLRMTLELLDPNERAPVTSYTDTRAQFLSRIRSFINRYGATA